MMPKRIDFLHKSLVVATFVFLYLSFIDPRFGKVGAASWTTWGLWLPIAFLAMNATQAIITSRQRIDRLHAIHPELGDDVSEVLRWHSRWATGNAITTILVLAAVSILRVISR